MTKRGWFTLIHSFFLFYCCSVYAQNILWQETTIPMHEAGTQGLETLLVWPNSPGMHPLALISHGSPRDAKQRQNMSALSFLPIAKEFARRGFAVAVVLRRVMGTQVGAGLNLTEAAGQLLTHTRPLPQPKICMQQLITWRLNHNLTWSTSFR